MDKTTLDRLLGDGPERQFWLKPVGPPKDHPEWKDPEHRTWTQNSIEVHFSKNPAKVVVGAIIIAYRIRMQKLIYVAERLPQAEWGPMDDIPEYWRLGPVLPAAVCSGKGVQGATTRGGATPLGTIQRGNDKGRIPRPFAEFLIRAIRDLP
jgi:hypothetical protein